MKQNSIVCNLLHSGRSLFDMQIINRSYEEHAADLCRLYMVYTDTITLCLKKWGTHIVPHSSHKSRALSIKFGTVNRKSILYNLSQKNY